MKIRFSEVVDDFTHHNLTPEDAIQLCITEFGMEAEESINKVDRGLMDEITWQVDQRRNDGLDRWRDAMRIVGA